MSAVNNSASFSLHHLVFSNLSRSSRSDQQANPRLLHQGWSEIPRAYEAIRLHLLQLGLKAFVFLAVGGMMCDTPTDARDRLLWSLVAYVTWRSCVRREYDVVFRFVYTHDRDVSKSQ